MPTLAEDKVFMFTGKLSITRAEAQSLVFDADGIPGTSVNSRTDYLVVGERPGSKLHKAEALGTVKIIDEREFYTLLEEIKYEELPVEEWKDHKINVIPGNVFESVILRWEEEGSDIDDKERTPMSELQEWTRPFSYEYVSVLNLLLEQHPNLKDKLTLESKECRHCGSNIPYSVRKENYYCFNCHTNERSLYHSCIWEDDSTLPENPNGSYKVCTICGNFKFFENEEFKQYVKLKETNNFGFSAEIIADVMLITPQTQQKRQYQGSIENRYSSEDIESLYAQYQLELSRKRSRRQAKFLRKWGIEA